MLWDNFDTIEYDGEMLSPINLKLRMTIAEELMGNTHLNIFSEYYIKESDTPEKISYDLYGDTQYWWLIIFINGFRSYFDFPSDGGVLNTETLDLDETHHWINVDKNIEADHYTSHLLNTGQLDPEENWYRVTNREYMMESNMDKRLILVLQPEILQDAINSIEAENEYN